jgi:hypothetical protein
MFQDEPSGPDLDGLLRRMTQFFAFSIAQSHPSARRESPDPDDVAGAHHLRVMSRHGIVDIMRGGLPPLDYETVARNSIATEVGSESAPVAGLRSIVGFKRLAGRGQDRIDLEELEALHGELPIDPIPSLDED